MKSFRFFILLASVVMTLSLTCACRSDKKNESSPLYGFTAISNRGEEVDFASFQGKVLLIVNTASRCGFTPQYEGLEALYKKYQDKGLVVIGFPCDQFGHQEPGSNEEIATFCKLNYNVTFPLMDKVEVNGENASPLFKWLYGEKPFAGFGTSDRAKMMDRMLSAMDAGYASHPDIKWNFTKFLIDREGKVVDRFEPTVEPEAIEEEIVSLL